MFSFFEAVFFIQIRRLKIPASFHCPPFTIKLLTLQSNSGDHAIKRCLDKAADLPLPAHDHPKDTGHDPSHCDRLIFRIQIIRDTVSIAQCKHPGKIDPHKIILLGPEISRVRQIVIS